MTGRKDDQNKPDFSLIPRIALEEMARGFGEGEKKYGRYNYAAGMEASRLVAATLRHTTAWMDGEDLDPDSGNHHLGHAMCCLAMLLHTQQLETMIDNRRTHLLKSVSAIPNEDTWEETNLFAHSAGYTPYPFQCTCRTIYRDGGSVITRIQNAHCPVHSPHSTDGV